ncbi:MAG: nicotinamide-nucleotide adenylyltransferase, partial [Thermoplasmata archaeon]
MTKTKTSLFLGRFQPFHNGHLSVVKYASKKYKKVIIAICSAQIHHTEKNPFTVWERHDMISLSLSEEKLNNIEIVAVPDLKNPQAWSKFIKVVCTDFDTILTNNDNTKELMQSVGVEIDTPPKTNNNLSATLIRKLLKESKDISEYVP